MFIPAYTYYIGYYYYYHHRYHPRYVLFTWYIVFIFSITICIVVNFNVSVRLVVMQACS